MRMWCRARSATLLLSYGVAQWLCAPGHYKMASTGSASEAPGDYSKRMRDKKIMLAQYPGPDAKRFYSWTNGPLAKHLANKDAPDKMPDVVMDLSYALDHKPGEVVELKYAERDPLENKIADSGENICD